jgi:hypothetical protein
VNGRQVTGTPFRLNLNFTESEHHDHTTGNTRKNTVVTFFGKIHDVPMDYLIRTLRSHDQEHHECTEHLLCWQHSKENWPGHFECIYDVSGGNCQANFPFPYNVFTMSWARKLGFVPSDSGRRLFMKGRAAL